MRYYLFAAALLITLSAIGLSEPVKNAENNIRSSYNGAHLEQLRQAGAL